MREYDIYLFDADGTITDTAELIYQCFRHSCSTYRGVTVERADVWASIGMPLRPQMEKFLGALTDAEYHEVSEIHMTYQFAHFTEYLTIFDGMKELIAELKERGKKLAVVTSRRKESLDRYLKHVGVLHYFDECITPEDTELHKPDPTPVLEALSRFEAKPEDAIFIGDAQFDVEAGQRAGCDTAFVTWSKVDVSVCPTPPTYLIANTTELLAY